MIQHLSNEKENVTILVRIQIGLPYQTMIYGDERMVVILIDSDHVLMNGIYQHKKNGKKLLTIGLYENQINEHEY
jgi:hypothetical protein